jgi:hypothetical protein
MQDASKYLQNPPNSTSHIVAIGSKFGGFGRVLQLIRAYLEDKEALPHAAQFPLKECHAEL